MFDLKEFRKDNGLTQIQAAEYFGCTQAFISGIERKIDKMPDYFKSKIKVDGKYRITESAFEPTYEELKEEVRRLKDRIITLQDQLLKNSNIQ